MKAKTAQNENKIEKQTNSASTQVNLYLAQRLYLYHFTYTALCGKVAVQKWLNQGSRKWCSA